MGRRGEVSGERKGEERGGEGRGREERGGEGGRLLNKQPALLFYSVRSYNFRTRPQNLCAIAHGVVN